MHPDVVVVGAGQSAMALARALRDLGHAGRIVLVGDEPIAPYERPPLSKQFLVEVSPPEPVFFTPAEWWIGNGVELRLGDRVARVEARAKRILLESGATLSYERLVIATGGSARPAPPAVTLRNVADAKILSAQLAVSKTLCVMGGGFLGLEVAASARTRGLGVTVLEVAPRLLERVLPAELSEWLCELHTRHGTVIHCNAAVTGFTGSEAGVVIVNAPPFTIRADCLVAAIGMQPNVSLAQEAGLRVQDGIVVDADCKTSVKDIFAIGDAACRPNPEDGWPRRVESWQNAEVQGAIAAHAIMGQPAPPSPVAWFWTEQYGLSIQVFGELGGDELVWRGGPVDPAFTVVALRQGRIVGGLGVNAGKDLPPLRQLISMGAAVEARIIRESRSMRDLLNNVRGRS
ncbi:MAG: hypothetical protein EPN67_08170 [Pusillimonas sp.]|nr:MAG: hypothetical protein EPN67_08170 [Pusillimonas sp.]